MKLQLSDVISICALAVSFLSIWLQGRSSQKQLLVANISEYTKRYQEIILNLPRVVLNSDFDINVVSEEEETLILRYMLIYFNLCFEEYTLYFSLKLVDKKVWKIWESGIRSSLYRPAFRQCWQIISQNSSYDGRFVAFMNSIASHHSP